MERNAFYLFINDFTDHSAEIEPLIEAEKESWTTLTTFYKPLVSDIEKRIKYDLKLPYYLNASIEITSNSIYFYLIDSKEKQKTTVVELYRRNNNYDVKEGRRIGNEIAYTETFELSVYSKNIKETDLFALYTLKFAGYVSDLLLNKDISDIYLKLKEYCKRYNMLEDYYYSKKHQKCAYQEKIAAKNKVEVYDFFDSYFDKNKTITLSCKSKRNKSLCNYLLGIKDSFSDITIEVSNVDDDNFSYRNNIPHMRWKKNTKKFIYDGLITYLEHSALERQFNLLHISK